MRIRTICRYVEYFWRKDSSFDLQCRLCCEEGFLGWSFRPFVPIIHCREAQFLGFGTLSLQTDRTVSWPSRFNLTCNDICTGSLDDFTNTEIALTLAEESTSPLCREAPSGLTPDQNWKRRSFSWHQRHFNTARRDTCRGFKLNNAH